MITKQEEKQIEQVFKKPFSEIEEMDIPTYIRKRNKVETLKEEAERINSETVYEETGLRDKRTRYELWDEDCGWRYYCGKCGALLSEENIDNCPHCHTQFNKTDRV